MTLEDAIVELQRELPGWYWHGGWCSVSRHASIGPDGNWDDARGNAASSAGDHVAGVRERSRPWARTAPTANWRAYDPSRRAVQ